jgi:ribosomal protein S18 acetylase RimI-like enzyme
LQLKRNTFERAPRSAAVSFVVRRARGSGMVEFDLRPASERDREFLYALHCSTMRDLIEQTWGWDDAWQRDAFQKRFAAYTVSVIEAGSRSVGSLWLEQRPDSLYVHDLQVTPTQQGRGIGTAVMERVIEQGAGRGLPVVLSVLQANPRVLHLYDRLGFRVTHVEPPFIRMRHDARLAEGV